MKKCLIGMMILGLATPVAAQPSSESLAQAPLPGLVIGYRAAQDGDSIVEWIPQGETVQMWTRMVTVQRFAGIGQRLQFWADTFASNIAQACPGAVIGRPAYSQTQGRRQVELRADCPRNPQTGQPETFMLRAISGATDLHSVQVAYRHVPNAEETQWAQRQLASATLCAADDARPICRTPAD